MGLPMLGRFGKRLLDFVHIAIASLWLGSFTVITGLFATQGAGIPGLDPSSLPLSSMPFASVSSSRAYLC